MDKQYHVSASPHVRSGVTTRSIMQEVTIALLPAAGFGIYYFGVKALLIMLVCINTCLISEYLYEKLMKKPVTTGDFSAVITGLLLGMNMPVSIPLWIPMLGSVFAIIVVKMLYGGLGQNFMNPALAARCFLLISFTGRMSTFTVDKLTDADGTIGLLANGASALDGISGATPLAAMKAGESVDLFSMFVGNIGGTIGETSALAILIGGIYLIVKKIISYRIPVFYLGTFAVFMLLFSGHGFDMTYILGQLCGGGIMLGAFFMATDYCTSPVTPKGQMVFGALLGIFTGIYRVLGGSSEGVSYAIIFCNLLVPLIEKITVPKFFGKGAKGNAK